MRAFMITLLFCNIYRGAMSTTHIRWHISQFLLAHTIRMILSVTNIINIVITVVVIVARFSRKTQQRLANWTLRHYGTVVYSTTLDNEKRPTFELLPATFSAGRFQNEIRRGFSKVYDESSRGRRTATKRKVAKQRH